VRCPRCQHENPPGSNFCLGCGTRLGATCSACGNDLPAGSRFCNKCGTPVSEASPGQTRFASPQSYTPKHLAEKILTSRTALEGERKQVTVLFADVKGFLALSAWTGLICLLLIAIDGIPDTEQFDGILVVAPLLTTGTDPSADSRGSQTVAVSLSAPSAYLAFLFRSPPATSEARG